MNAFTSVEAGTPVSAKAIGLSAQAGPNHLSAHADGIGMPAIAGVKARRINAKSWPDAKIEQLCALLTEGKTVDECATEMGIGRGAVTGQMWRMRQRGDTRLPVIAQGRRKGRPVKMRSETERLRRFGSVKPTGRSITLPRHHPAMRHARPLFANRVRSAADVVRVIKPGLYSRKIGDTVMKGSRRGWPIFTLTLPERTTCPRSCAAYASCYGNRMNWSDRIKPDAAFEAAFWDELAELQTENSQGFLLRLHVLGDFYSQAYVDLIDSALDAFPALHVFGFTARDPDIDEIGSAVWALATNRWDRFTMRFSGMPGPDLASRVIDHGATDPAAIVCPAQTLATACCATCALCFSPNFTRSIAFWRH